MICARCRHAFEYIVSNDDTWIAGSNKSREPDGREEQEKWHSFTHHPTHESFREAIDQRCSVCIVLWEELAAEQQSLLVDATRTHKDSTSGPSREASTLLQDAIFVSLELGIRYMWIDLLCIYQDEDNRADWHHESTLMNQVYSNTFCNISAGDANGCLESLFRPRDTDTFFPQVIEVQIGHRDGETQLLRVYDSAYWHRSVSRALVNTRAWVLQERFLSPRVLQFDTHQVLWECLQKSATETCPKNIPDQLVGRDHLIFKNLLPVVQTTRDPDSRFLAKVRHIWTCLVNEYTACNLTVPSDKLIAISGIAKHIAALLQDDYVAVTRGWLRLRGPLRPLRLVRKSLDRGHGWEWDIILEGVKATAPEISLTARLSYPTSPELRLDVFQEGFEEENANDMLFAMLARTVVVSHDKINDRRLEMLLLKLIDREKAIFERIGYAKIGNSAAEAVLEIQRPADAPPLPSLEYRDGMHSICIV
ncbi:hypothetical protein NEMBOFW57_000460 [Staphylotrichum longicolle]|uniref:Heterokaryon incompatibility domain-containing protein n=1 Tax=Staphylotrichum longicolle TaxID=669026 RepID=A0AAD4EZD0_9PEZI|nr:hypothetical protein NEMBOFW57_000460 [Staphylotrichum longicolle]